MMTLKESRRTALAGLVTMLHACLDMKALILGKYHYVLYFLVLAMQPRMLMTVDENLKPLSVPVRVGQAVDVVGQAGRPKTITGFQTHSTSVLLSAGDRAELATERYIPNSRRICHLKREPGVQRGTMILIWKCLQTSLAKNPMGFVALRRFESQIDQESCIIEANKGLSLLQISSRLRRFESQIDQESCIIEKQIDQESCIIVANIVYVQLKTPFPAILQTLAFLLEMVETVDYYWMVVFVPTAMVFAASSVYLIAGIIVAYNSPMRHACLKVVENNNCA
ncbi:uncharacterized protein [Henckelia pumila]|uniref:uncharacterized protein n=1 Tax=Henckelia pumila TaxID=405737 RepID=UPI003C6E3885